MPAACTPVPVSIAMENHDVPMHAVAEAEAVRLGIAGAVFTSGKAINIPYAYADLRFNPAFDKKTGYFTRSILCVPVINKTGKVIGVGMIAFCGGIGFGIGHGGQGGEHRRAPQRAPQDRLERERLRG